jgi:glycosyltransferase involved in cell wall biosynthesis
MADVCMLLLTPFTHDARVEKEATSLVGAGHRVRVIAVASAGQPLRESRDGYEILRVESEPLAARAIRRAIALRRGRANGGAGGAAPGTVVRLDAGPPAGAAARIIEATKRNALRVHLALHRRVYARAALREAAAAPSCVWIAHDLETLATGVAAKRRLGGGLLYDSHELYVERSDPLETRLTRRLWRRHEARLITRADRVTTVSDSIAGVLAERYGIERPAVVRNVPPYEPPPDPARSELRRAAGVDADAPLALYVGGLGPGRGIELLVRGARSFGDVQLALLGPARDGFVAELEALATANGVADRVHVLPPVPVREVRHWAASADVGLVPYPNTCLNHYFSLPTKLFDYLSSGLPVAVSDLPELGALVRRYDVGEVFDGEKSLARAVTSITGDRVRAERLRANAVNAARELTWESERGPLLEAVEALAASDPM